MIRVGIAGIGFMGLVHYLTYQKISGVKVVAICDRSPTKLTGDWTSIRGNFGPPGSTMDLTGVSCYQSLDDLIADSQVDVIDITLPPTMHCDIAVRSLQAGKHVFCEKPMAMNISDCDRMTAASQQSGRHLLIGHVLPYFPEYAWALNVIESGAYGKLISGSFKRVISDPSWLTKYWDPAVTGGPLLDLHIHDAHFIRLLFGMPVDVHTLGTTRNGLPEEWHSLFKFADPSQFAHISCGAIPQQGMPFCHGFEIRLERGTLVFEFSVRVNSNGETVSGYNMPPSILNEQGQCLEASLGDGDPMLAFESELNEVVRSIEGDKIPLSLSSELARDAIAICEMQKDCLIRGVVNR
jgi:predicted dehydrogenase